MSMSGVKCDDAIKDKVEKVRLNSGPLGAIFMKFNDKNTKIECIQDKELDKHCNMDQIMANIDANDAVWVYFLARFGYDHQDTDHEVPVFVQWVPEGVKVTKKMLFASSKAAIKSQCGAKVNLELTTEDQLCLHDLAKSIADQDKTLDCKHVLSMCGIDCHMNEH